MASTHFSFDCRGPRGLGLFAACLVAFAALQGCLDEPNGSDKHPLASVDSQSFDTSGKVPDISNGHPPVDVELESVVAEMEGDGPVRVRKIANREETLEGLAATGQAGDFELSNERVEFVVERDRRAMGPCPYGGNVVDAALKEPDFGDGGDILREICPVINGTQTFRPSSFEIIDRYRDRGVGVLAVTGQIETLDFINLESMSEIVASGIYDRLNLRLEDFPELTISIYYVIGAKSPGIRVVTAVRNDSQQTVHLAMSHIIESAGTADLFNPLNKLGGFGSAPVNRSNLDGTLMPFIAYASDDSSFVYLPEPHSEIADFPTSGIYLALKGVAVSLLGSNNAVDTVFQSRDKLESDEALLHLAPGDSQSVTHRHWLGDGQLQTRMPDVYDYLGVETVSLKGRAVGPEGSPVEKARITAIQADQNRTINRARTDENGQFVVDVLPESKYRLVARKKGQFGEIEEVDVESQPPENRRTIEMNAPASVEVSVTDSEDNPVPARVSLVCRNGCPHPPTSREADVKADSLPGDLGEVVRLGVDGHGKVRVRPGSYRIFVSRGITWSVWPADTPETGGESFRVESGDTKSFDAEIEQVVARNGVLSGDFHVHSINSPDSRVPLVDRVRNFLSEGVEVLVSTDHDRITDYQPSIDRLRANDEIVTLPGDEITTSDTGHFNAFPLAVDSNHPTGGALDWGNGPGLSLKPVQIFEWAKSFDGQQVVSVNHPASQGSGTIRNLVVDPLRGISYADPASMRLPSGGGDPEFPVDTGLWSEAFTAMELIKTHSHGRFWAIARWWMTMIGRGFHPTGTAVSDTHSLHGDLGGSPRSLVLVSEEHDTAATFDKDHFVERVNDGRVVGTTGPFFRVTARNADGKRAGIGQTLEAPEGRVTVSVSLQMPEWMTVDHLDLYANQKNVITKPGQVNKARIGPRLSRQLTWTDGDVSAVASGARTHRRRTKTVEFDLELSGDGYVIVVARGGDNNHSFAPVVPKPWASPIAFSNPILVDADGGGYDNPPLAKMAEKSPPERQNLDPHSHPHHTHSGARMSREEAARGLVKILKQMGHVHEH